MVEWKSALAQGAIEFSRSARLPRYDSLFVDEAQDLMPEEVRLLEIWTPVLFFVGDDRQKIFEHTKGLDAVRHLAPPPGESTLPFHYRLVPEICHMADRIMMAQGGATLAATEHYSGPRPGRIDIHGPISRSEILQQMAEKLRDQIRAYADLGPVFS